MAPTRLQAQITHRKMRKASWQPGVGHFPGTAVAASLSADTQEQPVRFCEQKRMRTQEPFKQKLILILGEKNIKSGPCYFHIWTNVRREKPN